MGHASRSPAIAPQRHRRCKTIGNVAKLGMGLCYGNLRRETRSKRSHGDTERMLSVCFAISIRKTPREGEVGGEVIVQCEAKTPKSTPCLCVSVSSVFASQTTRASAPSLTLRHYQIIPPGGQSQVHIHWRDRRLEVPLRHDCAVGSHDNVVVGVVRILIAAQHLLFVQHPTGLDRIGAPFDGGLHERRDL